MAASYIRIALLVLSGLALLTFASGFVYGIRTKRTNGQACGIALAVSILIFALIVLGLTRLSISGPLIIKQGLALGAEIVCTLVGGCICGLKYHREQKKSAFRSGVFDWIFVGILIAFQISNVQPLLETLQTAGILKSRDEYKPETNKDCPANLQSLYNAFQQYADLNDKLPDAANWEDNMDLTSRIPQDEWLHCPAISNRHDDKFGYALNDALTGKKLNLNGKPLSSLPNAATTPLLYDSTNLGKNAHDAGVSMPKPGRHGGRNNVLYLDGHVAAVAPK